MPAPPSAPSPLPRLVSSSPTSSHQPQTQYPAGHSWSPPMRFLPPPHPPSGLVEHSSSHPSFLERLDIIIYNNVLARKQSYRIHCLGFFYPHCRLPSVYLSICLSAGNAISHFPTFLRIILHSYMALLQLSNCATRFQVCRIVMNY